MARAMKYQAALLVRSLGLDEPHVGPADSFTDGLSVIGIVLLSFNVRLHVGRWHQPHGVAQRLQLARPMVRRGASLNADQAWRKLLEKRQDEATLQLTADDHLAGSINTMDLKDRFGDVETDCRNRLHG
jgi:hypothetical protein